jgi:hypothetical protein
VKIFDGWTTGGKERFPEIVWGTLNGTLGRGFLNRFLTDSRDIHRAFVATLRGLVDRWIESGRRDDLDNPFERTAPKRELAWFMAKYPPVAKLDPDGRMVIHIQAPMDHRAAAQDHALYWFAMLLDSPTRERLSKCDKCGEYILRDRMPRMDHSIKRGVFCKKHKGKARARSMASTRENRTDELVRLAARYWPEWNSKKVLQTRSKWIAARMNGQLPVWAGEYFQNRDGTATGRWVTEHRQDIEAEAERRKHATRKN